jgi:hypothetical protein
VLELDITSVLTSAGQMVSSTFQTRLGQEDNYGAAGITSLDGITYDDIRVRLDLDIPIANFQADITSGGVNPIINYTDLTTNSPASRNWVFPGGEHGNADPLLAFDGSNVLRVDLNGTGGYPGDYEPNLSDRQCQAVSPAFDCSGYTSVTVSFMRWLNVESSTYDHAYLDVFDGTDRWNCWSNTTTTIKDNTSEPGGVAHTTLYSILDRTILDRTIFDLAIG